MEYFYIRLQETTDQEVVKLTNWATSRTKDFKIIRNSWSTTVVGSLRSVTEEKTFINLVRTNTRNWKIKHLPFDNWIHKISRDEYIDMYGGYSDIQAMVYKIADSAVDKSRNQHEEARQLQQYRKEEAINRGERRARKRTRELMEEILGEWAAPTLKKRREEQETKERANDEKRKTFGAQLRELGIHAGLPHDVSKYDTIDDIEGFRNMIRQRRAAMRFGG